MKYIVVIMASLLISSVYAQLPDNISLEADYVTYTKKSNTLQASSNVQLSYQNLDVYTDNFEFNTETGEVSFPTSFILKNSIHNASGDSLYYNYNLNKGFANNIKITSDKLNLKAKKIIISPLKTTLYNATISNCNLTDPHITISSKEIDVYPLLGVVNAKKNWLHIHFLPFKIPLPIIPYGNKKHSLLGNNQFLPEFGQNSIMGSYAIYKSSYIINNYISGTANVGYTENLYWILGGSNILYQSPRFSQAIQYYYYNIIKEPSILAVTDINFNIPNIQRKKNQNILDTLIRPFTNQNQLNKKNIQLIIQRNIIEHSYWVDHLPKIVLSNNNSSFLSFLLNTQLFYSKTKESSTRSVLTKSDQLFFKSTLEKSFSLQKNIKFTPSLDLNTNKYDNKKNWNRLFFITKLSINTLLNPEISYLQKVLNKGKSPFLFEQEYALIDNEIGLKISESRKSIDITYEGYYTLEKSKFRKQKIALLYKFHCWGLGFNWKINENAFAIQLSLH